MNACDITVKSPFKSAFEKICDYYIDNKFIYKIKKGYSAVLLLVYGYECRCHVPETLNCGLQLWYNDAFYSLYEYRTQLSKILGPKQLLQA